MTAGERPDAGMPAMGVQLACRVLVPFAFGYFLSYLFRTVNAVIAPQLIADVGLDASQLGLMTAAYFITFAAIQLPLGMVLDSYGPRRVEVVLLLIAASGAFLFSIGHSPWALIVARGLIGIGVAACLMAALKALSEWYAAEKLPLMNGLLVASGGFGAVMATSPTKALVAAIGWRDGFILLAAVTVGAALLLWLVAPDKPRREPVGSMRTMLSGVGQVFVSRNFWIVAPVAATSQGAFLAIQTLWAGPWLRDVAGHDPDAVARVLLIAAIGFIVGNVASGSFTFWIARRGVAPSIVLALSMGLFMLLQLVIIAGWTAHTGLLWFTFGFFGTTGILSFSVLTPTFPLALTGRTATAMNLLIFVAAFALQWGIGIVIDQWPVSATGGYHPQGYQAAFGLALAIQAITFVLLLRGRRLLQPATSELR
jgi:predicted MFS family arabinose efflux permease